MLVRSRHLRVALAVALSALASGLLLRTWIRIERSLDSGPPGEAPAAVRAQEALATAGDSTGDVATGVRTALVSVVTGLVHPLFVTHAGDGSGRLFVVEQGGTIRVIEDGGLLEAPFLDLGSRLDTRDGERGLLGLAFAPDYARSGRFYVAHTAPGPVVRVARYRVSTDPDRADALSATTVLDMDDPAPNHNGGMLAFGPDGMLWIGTGDGGQGGDPWDHARDRRSLLGKILRLDVRTEPYSIPPDNPFARDGGAPEVWALGLRNPWRFSFDRQTGELWIGDVGQNAWEEVDVEDPKRGGARHYGWKTMEGRHCFAPKVGCDPTGLELPLFEYGHNLGCSVTGGYVYRGRALPDLLGAYLFSDYCRGTIWALRRDPVGRATVTALRETHFPVSSFGEDEAGELYLCDYGTGLVHRLAPQ